MKKLAKAHPEWFSPVDPELERKYKELWSKIFPIIDLNYLRAYCNFSGIHDYRYVPSDIYVLFLERAMNDINRAPYHAHKGMLEKTIGPDHSPVTYIRRVSGTYMDSDFQIITKKTAKGLFDTLRADLIIKPALKSGGGKGNEKLVFSDGHYRNAEGRRVNMDYINSALGNDFVIQEMIRQHEELSKFNPYAVNTLRFQTYRSPSTEEVIILQVFFISAITKTWKSNTSAGGCCTYVNENGIVGEFAFTKDLQRLTTNPSTGIVLKGQSIPCYHKIVDLVKDVAHRFPAQRLIGFDITVDMNENPIIIESNLKHVGIAQYVGGPLFGERTHEILEDYWKMKDLDDFAVLNR